MVEVVEDGQGLLPGVAGGLVVAGGVVGVAEVGQDGGFGVEVAEATKQGDGVLEALGCLVEITALVVDVAEAVPGAGLAVLVAQFLEQVEGVLAVVECVAVVAELGVAPADVVERGGLPRDVVCRQVEVVCLLGISQRLVEPALAAPAAFARIGRARVRTPVQCWLIDSGVGGHGL